SASKQRWRHGQTECLGCPEINGEFEVRWQFDGKLARFLALENPRHIGTGAAIGVCLARAITHQSSSFDKSGRKIGRWNGVERGKSNQLGAPTIDEWTCTYVERTGTGLHDGRKCRIDFLFSAGLKDNDSLPDCLSRFLDPASLRVMLGKIGVQQDSDN